MSELKTFNLKIDTQDVLERLQPVADEIQEYFRSEDGTVYSRTDLLNGLMEWLGSSIEQLVDDALFHTIEGDTSYAFNRQSFKSSLRRRPHLTVSSVSVEDVVAA